MSKSQLKKKIIIVGAGRMGLSIARCLSFESRFEIVLIDPVENAIENARRENFSVTEMDGRDSASLIRLLKDATAVVAATPGSLVATVAESAKAAGCHYIDLCEDTSVLNDVTAIAKDASSSFVPQCGLAPGYISSLVSELYREIGEKAEITVYVGVLPANKTNRLGYGNMWSIDGFITEYTKPCSIIQNGKKINIEPLSEYERITIKGSEYEAFTTSGSLDSVVDRLEGKVSSLVFKTLRFPGHLDYIQFLLKDLRLENNISQFKSLLLNGLAIVQQDQIVVGINTKYATPGSRGNQLRCYNNFKVINFEEGRHLSSSSAISLASSAHACSVIDLLCSGYSPHNGLVSHAELEHSLLEKSVFFKVLKQANPL